MDSVNSAPPTGAFGAAVHVKLYRARTLVRRHWWILLLAIGVGLALEGWIVYNKPDVYESTSELMVRDAVVIQGTNAVNENQDTLYGNTLKMLQSSEIIDGAKRKVELDAPQLSGKIAITATVTPRTSIFTVTGNGSNPDYTRRMVDAVVAEFMQQYRGLKRDDVSQTNSEVATTLDRLRKDLSREKSALDEFVKQNNMQFWARQMEESVNFLSGLKTRQAGLNTELQRLKTLTADQLLASPSKGAQPGNSQPSQSEAGPQSDSLFSGDLVQTYLTTTQELQAKQARIDERSHVWKPKHPKLQLLESEAAALRTKLEWVTNQAAKMTEARTATLESELKSLEISLATWNEKVKEASDKDGQFKILEAGVKRLQDQEDKLMGALVGLESSTGSGGILKVTRKASTAALVAKGTIKQLIIGLFGGLLAGGLIIS